MLPLWAETTQNRDLTRSRRASMKPHVVVAFAYQSQGQG